MRNAVSVAILLFLASCTAIIIGAGALPQQHDHAAATSPPKHAVRHVVKAPQSDPCDVALRRETAAMTADDAGQYARAYSAAEEGLAAVEQCDDPDDSLVNQAFLLSAKGFAEHYLPQGDSRTDLNEANQLLVECQTRPNLYGTRIAAKCETQEQNNIHDTTQWEIGD